MFNHIVSGSKVKCIAKVVFLFYANLAINFFLPFLVLIRNDNKRKAGAMIFVSIMVFVGHWIDFFQMIKPGVASGR